MATLDLGAKDFASSGALAAVVAPPHAQSRDEGPSRRMLGLPVVGAQ